MMSCAVSFVLLVSKSTFSSTVTASGFTKVTYFEAGQKGMDRKKESYLSTNFDSRRTTNDGIEYFNTSSLLCRIITKGDAEEVREKERANFCDYFTPSANVFDESFSKADRQANQQLDQLFGDGQVSGSSAEPLDQAAEDLFKKD